jgi:tetratricopeptide (TPR) repeat protein
MDHKESLQDQINSIIGLFSGGQTQEALNAIEVLIKDYPNEPLLYNISGVFYKQTGQLDEAIKTFEKAITINPDYAEAHNNLGVTLKNLGLMDEAITSYEKAIASNPDYAEAHNNLGVTLQNLDLMDEATTSYEKAIASNPDYAEAHNNLGNIFRELEQLDAAVKSYEKVTAINPDYPEAHFNLGNTLVELGQLETAIKSYEKVIAINPNYHEAHYNLGNTLIELGQLETAIKSYEKVIAINPAHPEAYLNLGSSLQQLGKLDQAIKCYEKAISIRPNYSGAYYNLSYLKKYTTSDPQIAKMQSLISSDDITQSGRIDLCFALAKVNENLDNQDELFKYLHEGNRLLKHELNYSLDRSKTLFSTVKEIFSTPYPDIEKSLSSEPSTFKPIFIVGMPRSGSTLVEQIISSHPAVHGAGEFQDLRSLIAPILSDDLIQGSEIASTSIGSNKIYLSSKASLPEAAFLSLRKQYLDALAKLNVSESVITDKSLLNFRFIGFILTAFPEAKIVHMKRDARAICWSIYKSNFRSKGNGYSYNFDDLAGFYGLYSDLMDFWHQLFPDRIYDMCYEDLTTNQEEETRKLLEYCELEWDDNCLSFHKNKRAVKTASAIQVREKMYQGSSEAWKKYEIHLKPLIKALSAY